jgi:hypothetical protein
MSGKWEEKRQDWRERIGARKKGRREWEVREAEANKHMCKDRKGYSRSGMRRKRGERGMGMARQGRTGRDQTGQSRKKRERGREKSRDKRRGEGRGRSEKGKRREGEKCRGQRSHPRVVGVPPKPS